MTISFKTNGEDPPGLLFTGGAGLPTGQSRPMRRATFSHVEIFEIPPSPTEASSFSRGSSHAEDLPDRINPTKSLKSIRSHQTDLSEVEGLLQTEEEKVDDEAIANQRYSEEFGMLDVQIEDMKKRVADIYAAISRWKKVRIENETRRRRLQRLREKLEACEE
ncbi:MAG: hypothetical protein LQ351_007135 [Letrouitia transgressa]|nr:MAG: hypothetical protein LQ351_007135 [Letrouitia transgressa]